MTVEFEGTYKKYYVTIAYDDNMTLAFDYAPASFDFCLEFIEKSFEIDPHILLGIILHVDDNEIVATVSRD